MKFPTRFLVTRVTFFRHVLTLRQHLFHQEAGLSKLLGDKEHITDVALNGTLKISIVLPVTYQGPVTGCLVLLIQGAGKKTLGQEVAACGRSPLKGGKRHMMIGKNQPIL